ncbi:MAG: ATP-binding protein [Bifidobacteriaceae bacterium]|jgi:predicted AAA+ superfamily ATPase|nr:ATP-binding protein [Bifidobacteriaceae bacterium]
MQKIKRQRELDILREAKNTNLIKVITGIRRSGKSTLLELFQNELIKSGISKRNIVSINFEDLDTEELTNYKNLHQHILKNLQKGMNYVFLDEIQMVSNFEKVVDSLYIRKNVDLYITGSNAFFMSGEFATLLTGRYVEIQVYPFSFAEFVSAFPLNERLDELFESYLIYGGFPEVVNLLKENKKKLIIDYLLGVYNTILNKDIAARFNMTNISTLLGIAKYLFDNIGNITSPKKIADFLSSNNNKTSYNTVTKYLNALSVGLIFYSVNRENIKGKQILQTLQKYYAVDMGLRRVILSSDAGFDIGHILENVVYFELLRRRNIVTIGKIDNAEVDFIAKNIDTNEKIYYQVAYSVKDLKTFSREISSFNKISDHYSKVLLTTDNYNFSENGIKHINIINWLLER